MLPDKEPQGILIVDDNPTNLEVLSESLIHFPISNQLPSPRANLARRHDAGN